MKKTRHEKTIRFLQLPPVLTIMISRYKSHNLNGGQWVGSRVDHDVQFSEELTVELESTPGIKTYKTYDLVAVCHQGGALDHGHYRAMCKIIPDNAPNVRDARARR
jgi:ubiquitin C-terminal hydrolase